MDFKNKKIVLTGTFESMKRNDAKKILVDLGADVTGSISKNTSILIAGAAAGSKLAKAEKLGVEIWTEDEFLEAIGMKTESIELSGPLADFKERFTTLVKELRAHPDIEVVYYNLGKPASEDRIKRVEKYIKAALDPAIKNFYRQCDGASLMWIYKDNEDKDRMRLRAPNNGYSLEGDGICDGCMNIFPIVDTFITNNWEGHHYFDGADYNDNPEEFMDKEGLTVLSFSKRLKIFDYHFFYRMMAFYVEEGNGNPPVLIGDDHGACFTDSNVTNFETYIEMILANKVHRDSRTNLYSKYHGHKKGLLDVPKSHWTKENSFDLDKRSFGTFEKGNFWSD